MWQYLYSELRGCVGFHDTPDITDKTHDRVTNFSRAHDKRLGSLGSVGVLTLCGFLVRPTFFALKVEICQERFVASSEQRMGHDTAVLPTAFPMTKVY